MTEPMDIDFGEVTLVEASPPQAVTNPPAGGSVEAINDQFTSFTPFPRLPLELRLTIWELSMSEPRIISVKPPYRQWRARLDSKSRAAAVPALLHVSAESRLVALKKYSPLAARWGKPVFFDFQNDTLSVQGDAFPEICGGQAGRSFFLFPVDVREWHVKLRHLKLTDTYDWGFDTRVLQWMKSLETLAIEKRPPKLPLKGLGWRGVEDTADDILAKLCTHWLGPEDKLPTVTLFAYT